MFTTTRKVDVPDPESRKPIGEYIAEESTAEQYIQWIKDYLGVTLTPAQQDIIRAFCDNQKTLVVGANGFGKTFCLAALSLAFLYTNYPSVVMATSGTYGKMKRTYCQPVKEFHQNCWGLPGRYLVSKSRIRIDDEPNMYWEASSPADPGELEGVHTDYLMGVIEEADKNSVNEKHFDSMESLLTDRRDKLIASANPPPNAGNVIQDLMDDDTWETVRFSSFDAENVQIEMNHPSPYRTDADGHIIEEDGWPVLKKEVSEQMVNGVVRLRQIKNDWESWNRTEWPGLEEAMASDEREDLDVRWYRRRLGVKPPELAVVHRPYTIDDVDQAWDRDPAVVTATPDGLGLDVARGTGDYNALVGVFGRDIRVLDYWHLDKGETHVDSENHVRDILEPTWDCRMAVDAIGEGSGLADMINEWYPNTHRFQNNANAIQGDKYKNKWTESNAVFGQMLRDGGGFTSTRLREEVQSASRALEFSESYTKKRGVEVLGLTSKDKVKRRLGRSPDILDAALMAAWSASDETTTGPKTIPSTW